MKQAFRGCALVFLFFVSSAQGQGNDQSTIGMFLVPENDAPRNLCAMEARDCEDPELKVAGQTYETYVMYICVFNGDATKGVSGAEFGIDYDGAEASGVDIFSNFRCSDLAFESPGWPDDGTGVVYTWVNESNCQQEEPGGAGSGVTAVAAAFTVFAYSPDRVKIINKRTVEANVIDCSFASSSVTLDRLGSVAFSEDGTEEGNPGCTRAVIEDATWGAVKKDYGN